jgi:hypothetical protein
MLPAEFLYIAKFPTLTDTDIQAAIDAIEAQYYGVIFDSWNSLDSEIRDKKRFLVENLLIAWYLANTNPASLEGVVANGLPLSSKSAGGVSISMDAMPVQEGMENLKTNTFGIQALQMILSMPERFVVYG